MTISELTPTPPDDFPFESIDHLSANAYYFRLDTEFFDGFPFPVLATYFTKTPQALTESAFDVILPLDNPLFQSETFSGSQIMGFSIRSR